MTKDLYTARRSTPEPTAPLLFAFHGTGGDENQFFDLAQHLVPDAGVIAPRGDVLEHGAARFFRRTGEGVYDMADLAKRTDAMVRFVEAQRADHPTSPIWGFGYSNGANILASMVMSRPDLFDRVGLLHPLIPWSPAPLPGLTARRLLITAGRRDPICPWPLTERLVTWARDQGAQVATHIHDGGHELHDGEILALRDLFHQRAHHPHEAVT